MAEQEKVGLSRLKSLGIRQKKHLPLFLPRAYDDFTNVKNSIKGLEVGEIVLLMGKVVNAPHMVKDRTGREATPARYSMTLSVGGMNIDAVGFGKLFGSPLLQVQDGDEIVIKGKFDYWRDEPQICNLELVPHQHVGRIIPVYPSKKGVIAGDALRDLIKEAMEDDEAMAGAVNDIRRAFNTASEAEIVQNAGAPFSSVRTLLEAIHAPLSFDEAEAAIDAARRISVCELHWRPQRLSMRMPCLPSAMNLRSLPDLVSRLPFKGGPTQSQVRVMNEIADGLRSPYPMRRLLSGDVGTGKTAAYAIPAVAAWLNGARVAIMIPNQLLMSQVAAEIKEWFPEVDVKVVADGADIKKIDMSTNPFLVGTTSLNNFILKQKPGPDGEEPWRPDFLIVDEQQKMSRDQREALLSWNSNFLEATATCVPRTAALVAYGGMDVSVLNEFPVQKNITTSIVGFDDRGKLFNSIKATVTAGKQAAIIYPKVGSADEKDALKSVEAAYVQWEKMFPGKVAKLHGKMKDDEKIDVMKRMKAGEFSILIASTVVEVGVTIPSLTSLTVVDPGNYGVSTLHQLRGRVARHGGDGDFYLYQPGEMSDETRERLELLVKYKDGFELAEKDMEMRGFGDLSLDSDEQSGATASGTFLNMKITPSDLNGYGNGDDTPAAGVKLASGRRRLN